MNLDKMRHQFDRADIPDDPPEYSWPDEAVSIFNRVAAERMHLFHDQLKGLAP